MAAKTYMILLVDRKQAKMFILREGSVGAREEFQNGDVPRKVKHGDDTWDAPDKIFRHIEDHLHRHLKAIGEKASDFAKKYRVDAIIIGSHIPLFAKIEKHLPYPLPQKVRGRFITELKAPFGEILTRAEKKIKMIESKKPEEKEMRRHGPR